MRAAAVIAALALCACPTSAEPSASRKLAIDLSTCKQVGDYVNEWYYERRHDGAKSERCLQRDANGPAFSMLRAYRAGGEEGIHWRYTEDANDPSCLENWKYYSADGQTLYATIAGRTTNMAKAKDDWDVGKIVLRAGLSTLDLKNISSPLWCALPVYRPGGVQGKQWESCSCAALPTTPPPPATTAPSPPRPHVDFTWFE